MTRRHRRRASRSFDTGRVGEPQSMPAVPEPDPLAVEPTVRVMAYGPGGCIEQQGCAIADLPQFLKDNPVTWVDVAGLGRPELVRSIGAAFHLHELAIDDVLHVSQRPKLEPYAEFLYLVLRMADWVDTLETEQLSLFIGKNWVLTFQEDRPGDCFDVVRERIRTGKGHLRTTGADHLAHALIDAVIDSQFPILEAIGEKLEDLEGSILEQPSPESARQIQQLKRELLTLRRITWPTRDALGALHRDPTPLIGAEARILLRDCHDHAVQIMDLVETFREIASGIMELYLSSVSNRMNEIMKVLTIISTIFMPLSFLAGVFGMNFVWDPVKAPTNMPELHWPHGYVFALSLMGVTAVILLIFFWARGWLGGRR